MKKAFSLVEIITILFIVSVGLLGVLSLIIQNIQSQSYNKNNLIAYQLAQEGVELIRFVRDTNWRQGDPFNTGLATGQFYMDYQDTEPQPYSGNANDILLRQDAAGYYVHGGSATSTGFSRLITLSRPNAHNVDVRVNVTWQERGGNASYDLETLLYDWK